MSSTPSIHSKSSSESPRYERRQIVSYSKLHGRSVEQLFHFNSNRLNRSQGIADKLSQIVIPNPDPIQISTRPKIENWDSDFSFSEKNDLQQTLKYAGGKKERLYEKSLFSSSYFDRLEDLRFRSVAIDPDGDCLYNAVIQGILRIHPEHLLLKEGVASLRLTVQAAILSSVDFIECITAMLVAEVWGDLKDLAVDHGEFYLENVPEDLERKFRGFYDRYVEHASEPGYLELLDSEVSGWIRSEGWVVYSQGIADGVTFSGGVEAQVLSGLFETPIRIHKVEEGVEPFVQDVGDCNVAEEKILHLLLTGNHYTLLVHPKQECAEDNDDLSDSLSSNSSFEDSECSLSLPESYKEYYQIKMDGDHQESIYKAVLEGVCRILPSHAEAGVDSKTLRSMIEKFNPDDICRQEEIAKEDIKHFAAATPLPGGKESKMLSLLYATPIRILIIGVGKRVKIIDVGECRIPEQSILHLTYKEGKYALLLHPRQMNKKEMSEQKNRVFRRNSHSRDASPIRKPNK